MNSLQILQLINGILQLTPTILVLIEQIRNDINAGNSDAETAALLAQVESNHAEFLALLAAQQG
jgi:hypothetical protein